MKRLSLLAFAVLVVALAMRTPRQQLAAQEQTSVAKASSGDIDPDAMAALNKMGSYLRSLKAFQVEAVTTRDEVLDDGQQIQFDSHVDLLASMPDRLRVEVENARRHQLYFFDGKNFTLFAQRVNYYATVPAPPTIAKLSDQLDEKFGIELPLEDLFLWGTPRSKIGEIKSAMNVGPSQVGGVTCEHFAFRQDGLDWQVWIQQGDYPLPRRLVLTTLTDDARPKYSSEFTWNLAPSFNNAAFVFDPPSGAQRIAIATQTGEKK
jgi:hypothetical protein